MRELGILTVLLVAICSCQDSSRKVEELSGRLSRSSIDYQIDTIKIELDTLSKHAYFVYNLYSEDNSEYLVGYNNATHSFDVFDLTIEQFVEHIHLQDDGPNRLLEVRGLYVHNWDSIFVYTNMVISIVDRQGQVIDNHYLFQQQEMQQFGVPITNYYFLLRYSQTDKSILLFNTHSRIENTSMPIVSKYDIMKKELIHLPIGFTDYFLSNDGMLGHLSYLCKDIYTGDSIFFTYLYDSKIYIFDKKESEIKSHLAQRHETENLAKPVAQESSELYSIHAIESPMYFQILEDRYRGYYYQFHWGGIPYKTGPNTYNSFMDKPLFLSIFDKNLSIIAEISLPQAVYSVNFWVVNKEGLVILPAHPRNTNVNEDILELHVLKFDENL